jgi:hypothetical protein
MREKSVVLGTELVVVGTMSLLEVLDRVTACQSCSAGVSRPFRSVLTETLGANHPMSEFVMADAAVCPNCDSPIFENTLVRCEGEPRRQAGAVATYPTATSLDDTDVILVDEAVLTEAACWISGCQRCTKGAEMTFDYVLDAVMDSDDPSTEYVMCRPVHCPRCQREVTEKTFIVVH